MTEKTELQKNLAALLSATEKNSEEIAERLVARFLSAASIAAADYYELTDVCGLSPKSAVLLRTAFALGARRRTEFFKLGKKHTEDEIVEYLKGLYYDLSNETLYLLTVDADDRIISSEYVGEGTVNAVEIVPRKLLEILVKRKCKRAIIAHNHPGGYATASVEDIDTTARIDALFRTAERELICHYVIAGDEFHKIEPGRS